MNRRQILLALIPVNVAVAVFADSGWNRATGVFFALACLFAYLHLRTVARLASTDPADWPVGTVIELNGMTAKKTGPSDRDPWPWTSAGVAYSDEWAAGVIAGGARPLNRKGGKR